MQVSFLDACLVSKQLGCRYFETSAKSGINTEQTFKWLSRECLRLRFHRKKKSNASNNEDDLVKKWFAYDIVFSQVRPVNAQNYIRLVFENLKSQNSSYLNSNVNNWGLRGFAYLNR